jgi:P2-related tail formation protein
MKLFYSVNRLLVLLLTVSFLISSSNSFSQTALSFTTIPVSDPDLNAPGRGAEQWHDRTDVNIPVEGTNTRPMDVYYRFVATRIATNTQGVYNWSYLDGLINDAINNRQKFSFGIMTCYPEGTTNEGLASFDGGYASYPQWLHQQMQSESVKDWRTGPTWTPNYNSNYYLNWLLDLNTAVNAHIEPTSYNGVRYRDVVNCIDIRGYGAWGEWHSGYTPNNQISDYPSGTFPTVASLKRIVDAHVNGFPNFQLVCMIAAFDANYLGNTRNPPEIAHYILTHQGTTKGPIGWRRDQWGALDDYLKAYLENNTRSFNGVVFNTLIMDRWKTAPITGEPPAWNPDEYSDLERQIRLYHAASFGNGNYGGGVAPSQLNTRNRIRAASKASGYRLVIEGGSMATAITTGTAFPITLNWKNVGLSPTYENWDIVFELKNSGGTTVWSGTSAQKLRLFLPQTNATPRTDNLTVPTSVAAGTYSLILYVKDPTGYRQPLPLAITGRRSDGGYVLRTSINVTTGTGQSNTPPVANAGADRAVTLPTSSASLTGSGTDADGTIAGYLWQQISGPSTSTLSATNTANITVSNLQAGTYTYRLTVTDDKGATDTDDVIVTVSAATANQAPVANAGANKTITLPASSATLSGSGTDADGTIAGYSWQQVSGPSTSTLSATNTANITVSNLQAGVYTYRLTVTDNGAATATDDVTVTVNAAVNVAPVANAGANKTITLPASSATLNGSGTDTDGTIATYLWQQVSGPSASAFSATNTAGITVSNLQAGLYTYRLTVTDNDNAAATDLVTVRVNAATNQAPVANAGANKTITLPASSTTLTGSGTDADGTIAGYLWSQLTGPSTSTLSATNTANITVSNLQAGVYTYRLTVTDNSGAASTDDVTVTVNAAANQAPVANAGTNKAVTLPTSSTILSGTGTDVDGTIASYLWQQVSGPTTSALSATNTANITVSNLQAGAYIYRLTVTDNDGVADTDDVTVTVNNTPANQAPNANAGPNRTVTLPTNSATLNGSGTDADGTIATYLWQQVTGPSASALSATNTAGITVSNLQAGVYSYRLTVTDNDGATDLDLVTVTLTAAPNQAPVANAGANKAITLPTNTTSLSGAASTDADGTIASYQWQQVSGPSASTLSATNTAGINVSNLQAGVYTYRLTVTDNDNTTDNDLVTVTVNVAPNQAPVANAGANKAITLPTNSTSLSGSTSTDADGTISSYQWQQVSGPSASALSATNTAGINVSNLQAGVYTYRLTVTDNDNATATDEVTVTVNSLPNQAPIANAGTNLVISLPTSSASLSGSGIDADGTIAGYQWQQISGPTASTLSATTTANITVSNLQGGVYIYRLTVRDNDNATGTDNVTITVNTGAPNQAPVADAGPDQTIVVTANSTTLTAEQSADPDGTITNYLWQQVSGPGTSVFSTSSGVTVDVSNLLVGEYMYRLTVRDNKNATATATVKVIVIDNFRNFTNPVVVYPNPAQDVINIRLQNPKPGRVTINVYDMTGKIVLPKMEVNKPAGAYSVPVTVSRLMPGSYVIQVSTFGYKKMATTFIKL